MTSDRQSTEQPNSEAHFRRLLEHASDALFILDADGQLRHYSARSREWLGYTDAEMATLSVFDWDVDITRSEWLDILQNLGPQPVYIERRHRRKDGTIYDAGITAVAFDTEEGPLYFSAVRDISAQKVAQQTIERQAQELAIERDASESQANLLQTKQDELQAVMDLVPVGIALINNSGLIDHGNRHLARLAGRDEASLPGMPLTELFCRRERARIIERIVRCAAGETTAEGDFSGTDADVVLSLALRRVPDQFSLVATVRDVTVERASERQLEFEAKRDALTGLGNRRLLAEDFNRLSYAQDRYGRPFSLLIMDFDDFKSINDRYGHERGDQLLQEFAVQATASLRRDDAIYRVGGEEFVALLSDSPQPGARAAAENLCQTIAAGLRVEQQAVTVSIGGVTALPGAPLDALLLEADRNLYAAKARGKNRVVFSPAPDVAGQPVAPWR